MKIPYSSPASKWLFYEDVFLSVLNIHSHVGRRFVTSILAATVFHEVTHYPKFPGREYAGILTLQ
jgi:hypothetical protein